MEVTGVGVSKEPGEFGAWGVLSIGGDGKVVPQGRPKRFCPGALCLCSSLDTALLWKTVTRALTGH